MGRPRLSRQERLKQEKNWYSGSGFDKSHWLNSALFYSRERNDLAFAIAKKRLSCLLMKKGCNAVSKCLVAPCGAGGDLEYLPPVVTDVVGIDISKVVLLQIHNKAKLVEGDLVRLPFQDDTFDFILANLFFHHVSDEGFDAYLKEFFRVLPPRGWLITLEPSILFPFYWITQPIQWLLKENITGRLEHEGPISPFGLVRVMKKTGFVDLDICAASFSHSRFYVPIARLLNLVQGPFLNLPVVKYFGWLIYLCGKKPKKKPKYEERSLAK